jgi:hypothetical protein
MLGNVERDVAACAAPLVIYRAIGYRSPTLLAIAPPLSQLDVVANMQ